MGLNAQTGGSECPFSGYAAVTRGGVRNWCALTQMRRGMVMPIQIKRAYEPASPDDGYRVLIDRLWPRGLSRQSAGIDDWVKELAPSTELRRWFAHDPGRFEEFRRRYIEELRDEHRRLSALRRRARDGRVTLVYSAHDTEHNDAVVLAEVLRLGLPKIR